MKQLIAISGILLLTLGIPSCSNQDWSFPDFDYTTTYFPYQFPIRTLVLGEYNFDNSADNELRFTISARMGGVYKNKENITVTYTVDPSLTDSLYTTAGLKLNPLPTNLYELNPTSTFTIPSGKFDGGIEVQLDDAFLDDPLAISLNYVIPLQMENSTTDSILLGYSLNTNPDPRIAGEWITRPRNFTLFGIQFVNQYHGRYLMRGIDIRVDSSDVPLDTIIYRNIFVERCEVVSVNTNGRNSVRYINSVRRKTGTPGTFNMLIDLDASGNGTAVNDPASAFPIAGTAKYVQDADEWGGERRNTLYLDYVISQGGSFHNCKDTLVFRDKAVSFNEYSPLIKKPAP
jgi:hypothetical protein